MTNTTPMLKLTTLTCKTSARGTEYLQGILGGLNIVAFKGKTTQWGETWDVFIQERASTTVSRPHSAPNGRPDQTTRDLFTPPLLRSQRPE